MKTAARALLAGALFFLCLAGAHPARAFIFHGQEGFDSAYSFGPFLKSDDEFGVRPLFYVKKDPKTETVETDILYPFFHYKRARQGYRAGFLFNAISFGRGPEARSEGPETDFRLYPLIFYRSSLLPKRRVFAVAPFYGNFGNSTKFYMLPLYFRTESERGSATNIMWPILAFYSGDREGFRLWPLFGSHRQGDSHTRFALWPFYFEQKKGSGPSYRFFKSLFPFYYRFDYGTQSHRIFLWPLFQKSVDPATNLRSWHMPWPLVNFKRSDEGKRIRFFPFFGTSEIYGVKKARFFLWPLYGSSRAKLETYEYKQDRVLLALKIRRKKPFGGTPDPALRIDFWPVFSYAKDGAGNSHFHMFSPLESVMGESRKIYRNYAFLWRVFETRRAPGRFSVSALFGAVGYRRSCGEKSFYIVPKMFGYSSDAEGRRIRFLFIPVKIGGPVEDAGSCVA